jgi:polyisoprenoid-binding protein YceI
VAGARPHEGRIEHPDPEEIAMTATAVPVRLAPGRWTALPDRSSATFAVGNLGVKVVHGSISVVAGALDVDGQGRPVAVRAELDLRTIDTGIPKRDADLRKPALLDIDAHPVLAFSCTDVRPDDAGWRAEGRLSARGTSCPLTVTGTVVEDSPAGTAHVQGTAVLDRTALGMRAPRLMIGRLITITVDAWLTSAGR